MKSTEEIRAENSTWSWRSRVVRTVPHELDRRAGCGGRKDADMARVEVVLLRGGGSHAAGDEEELDANI